MWTCIHDKVYRLAVEVYFSVYNSTCTDIYFCFYFWKNGGHKLKLQSLYSIHLHGHPKSYSGRKRSLRNDQKWTLVPGINVNFGRREDRPRARSSRWLRPRPHDKLINDKWGRMTNDEKKNNLQDLWRFVFCLLMSTMSIIWVALAYHLYIWSNFWYKYKSR